MKLTAFPARLPHITTAVRPRPEKKEDKAAFKGSITPPSMRIEKYCFSSSLTATPCPLHVKTILPIGIDAKIRGAAATEKKTPCHTARAHAGLSPDPWY